MGSVLIKAAKANLSPRASHDVHPSITTCWPDCCCYDLHAIWLLIAHRIDTLTTVNGMCPQSILNIM